MYRIGVDLGGTNIVAGIIDEFQNLVVKNCVRTPRGVDYHEIVSAIYEASKNAAADANISFDEVERIGVCSPGTVNTDTGEVEFAGNIGFHNVPLRSELQNAFKKEVHISNDANAIAYGEAIAGAGKGKRSLIAITLGTGVGAGYYCNGKILSGINFAAGEMGHMVIEYGGRQCKCGRKGCFEAYASATALIEDTKRAMRESPDSLLWQLACGSIDNVDAKLPFDAAKAGDEKAKKIVSDYIGYLACGITNIINIFQPDVLCISGGVSAQGEYLISPLRKITESERFSKYAKKQTEICAGKLYDSAGIIGAAML